MRAASGGRCGAAIYSCRAEDPPFYWLRTGAIRQRAEFIPMAQGFCDTAVPWATDLSGGARPDLRIGLRQRW